MPGEIGGYRRPLLESHSDLLPEAVENKKGDTLREIPDDRAAMVNAIPTAFDELQGLALAVAQSKAAAESRRAGSGTHGQHRDHGEF
jgi:hypothetical protein